MNAQTLVQLLILLDQITAQVITLVKSLTDVGQADETALRTLIAEHRAKNDERFESVLKSLKAKSE